MLTSKMMIMKIYVYNLLILCSLVFASCELDLNPESEISEGAFYKNSEEINEAVIGCYNGLQKPIIYEWVLTELRSDNTQMDKDNSISIYTEYRELDAHTVTSQNILVQSYWNACYHDIVLANQVLGQSGVVQDEVLRKQYEGECHFIRAYHYFNLVRLFGPVPLITETISGSEAKLVSRSSIEPIYAFIESNLQSAIDELPETYEDEDLGRVTVWAAKALLAKVYLTRSNYSEAVSLLSDIITKSPYGLAESYADIFDVTNEMNSEILFAVRFMSGSVGLGSPFANYFAPKTSGNNVVNGDGDGLNYPTDDLIAAFDTLDQRKDVCLKENYYDASKDIFVGKAYVNKFMDNVIELEDAENDWPVLRYADVLLMNAEAINEQQGVSAALPYLNMVRERAGLDGYTETEITNKYQFRMALENERRFEFAFENHRYFDLLRTNRALTVMNQHFQTEAYYNDPQHVEFHVPPLDDWQTILPIPQRERDINPDLTQNQGY
jgi:starch-binding outer membrane protein, SusD/RagB family